MRKDAIILVDMDGVLCNFSERVIVLASEKLGAPLLSEKDVVQFDIENCYPEEFRNGVRKLSEEEGFFSHLEPIDGAVEALRDMETLGYKVFICTSPKKFYRNSFCAGEKHRWVMHHLGPKWTERIILTRDKTLVHGDVLIDDKPEVTGVTSPSWKHVYFDQPYNRQNKSRPRISSWGEWRHVIDSLLV